MSHDSNRRPPPGRPGPLYNPADPFRDAIKLVSGGREPPDYVRGWDYADLSEEDQLRLQDWLSVQSDDTPAPWGTGLGAMEAAEHIVAVAIENGNIWHPSDKRWHRG